eukprot:CAMPEP_0195510204 /NCGR_PEP_ID=MMETSP0794_2-20130614/2916_1 /TAXON_ID=515487 /ORGANISM="Stephanopyxis turris, Strain CCMP 815" /LENGTH=469 /DNA_ID=CAMNT_0040637581 /DNA_START=30 /DNA_END=1439 /DNA_ORIENTATION=-
MKAERGENSTKLPKAEVSVDVETKADETGSKDDKTVKILAERLKFFFSDANLRCDRFMRHELEDDRDNMVSITKLLRFNSIKKLTTGPTLVAKAAEAENNVNILKLNSERTAIGRVVPFDPNKNQDNVPLTLVVDGLPMKECNKKYAVTVPEIIDLFSPFGKVTLVRLRWSQPRNGRDGYKRDDRNRNVRNLSRPLGSAFVEFETEKIQKKVAAELCVLDVVPPTEKPDAEKETDEKEPKQKLKFNGKDLRVETMSKWIARKHKKEEEYRERKNGREGDDRKRGREESSPGNNDDTNRDKMDTSEGNGGDADFPKFKIEWEKNCVIRIKGLPDDCQRETIRDSIEDYLLEDRKAVYFDFSRGQKDGAIRFNTFSDKIAELASKIKSGDIKVQGQALDDAFVLEGDEEQKYWETFIEFKTKQQQQIRDRKRPRNNNWNGGRGRGRGGRGGRGGGFKGGHGGRGRGGRDRR